MNAIAALSTVLLAGWSLTAAAGAHDTVNAPEVSTPVAYLVLVANADECHCVASTGSDPGNNDTVIECAGGTAGSIFVTTPSKTNGECNTDGAGGTCSTKEGAKCKATVKATIMWPSPATCCASAAVSGPQIGTDQNPCQVATHGSTVPDQTWNLTAKCKAGAGPVSSTGSPPMKVWCNTACPSTGLPNGTPTAAFAPVLYCAPCSPKPADPL